MKKKMKRCPFCGGDVKLYKSVKLPFMFYVHHVDESSTCFIAPVLSITAMKETDAIEAWNRRAE